MVNAKGTGDTSSTSRSAASAADVPSASSALDMTGALTPGVVRAWWYADLRPRLSDEFSGLADELSTAVLVRRGSALRLVLRTEMTPVVLDELRPQLVELIADRTGLDPALVTVSARSRATARGVDVRDLIADRDRSTAADWKDWAEEIRQQLDGRLPAVARAALAAASWVALARHAVWVRESPTARLGTTPGAAGHLLQAVRAVVGAKTILVAGQLAPGWAVPGAFEDWHIVPPA